MLVRFAHDQMLRGHHHHTLIRIKCRPERKTPQACEHAPPVQPKTNERVAQFVATACCGACVCVLAHPTGRFARSQSTPRPSQSGELRSTKARRATRRSRQLTCAMFADEQTRIKRRNKLDACDTAVGFANRSALEIHEDIAWFGRSGTASLGRGSRLDEAETMMNGGMWSVGNWMGAHPRCHPACHLLDVIRQRKGQVIAVKRPAKHCDAPCIPGGLPLERLFDADQAPHCFGS